ncbi:unnamed protein product [Ceutorhynchus assimilis]|uniref:Uncharacterized protein n=1 Tax=Ceutorhynchus assimilis TaxID=467358 RepID=A0A9N9MEM9_9CUCU|nr:unnamed protein product [Ceutorhynchus assimilis]
MNAINGVPYPIILGMAFLKANQATLDLNRNTIKLEGQRTSRLSQTKVIKKETPSGIAINQLNQKRDERKKSRPRNKFGRFRQNESKITQQEIDNRIQEVTGKNEDSLHVLGVNRHMETRGLNEQMKGMFPDLKRSPGRVGQVTIESLGGKIALFHV